MDPIAAVDAVRRSVIDTTREGRPARAVVAERTYPAGADDVWDALTNPERIPRWFLPITGDLRLGGRYSLEGNASGTITACDPPRHLAVTWELGGATSWVDVHLTEARAGDATTLRLEHAAPIEGGDDFWERYGPGAVGVGWDLPLGALAQHLVTGTQVEFDPADAAALAAMRRSSVAWGAASIAYGTPPDQAEAAAARTTAFYTGEAPG